MAVAARGGWEGGAPALLPGSDAAAALRPRLPPSFRGLKLSSGLAGSGSRSPGPGQPLPAPRMRLRGWLTPVGESPRISGFHAKLLL